LGPVAWLVPAAVRRQVTEPPAGLTEFERAGGKPMVFVSQEGGNPFCSSLLDKAALFDEQVAPATQKLATRTGYWSAWRSFVTFLLLHGAADQAFPSSEAAIKAFAMQLIMVDYAGSSLLRFFEAIVDRHKRFDQPLVVTAAKLHAWRAALEKGRGLPAREKFLILPAHIHCIIQLPRDSLRHLRDTTIVVVGALCALRAAEIGRLDVCDVLWDFDGAGTAALLLWYRKNDGLKRGLFPRIGRGTTAGTCPIVLLREYMQRAKLEVSAGCTKSRWRRSECTSCGRLFRGTTAGGQRMAAAGVKEAAAKDVVTAAVRESLRRIGVEPTGFSPVSLRKGGVSAAVAAGVNETLWRLQSGHRSMSWQNYADVFRKEQLYEFSNAFGL
jgi:integrase